MKKLVLLFLVTVLILITGCVSSDNYKEYEAAKQFKYSHRSNKLPVDKKIGFASEWECPEEGKGEGFLLHEFKYPECSGESVGGCGFTAYRMAYVCDDEYYIGNLEPAIGDEEIYGPFKIE